MKEGRKREKKKEIVGEKKWKGKGEGRRRRKGERS